MSEIKQINTGVAELLVINNKHVPRLNGEIVYHKLSKMTYDAGLHDLDYEILGIDPELAEEQCRDLVTKGWNIAFGILYKGAVRYHVTAQKAFASLMKANGINEPRLILKKYKDV